MRPRRSLPKLRGNIHRLSRRGPRLSNKHTLLRTKTRTRHRLRLSCTRRGVRSQTLTKVKKIAVVEFESPPMEAALISSRGRCRARVPKRAKISRQVGATSKRTAKAIRTTIRTLSRRITNALSFMENQAATQILNTTAAAIVATISSSSRTTTRTSTKEATICIRRII